MPSTCPHRHPVLDRDSLVWRCQDCGEYLADWDCPHRNGAIDWDTGAWVCYDCGAHTFEATSGA